ncbi:microtubule-associated protein futsch-like [Mya arenaria]|uniref:microtubule-associated protein futsch-like n=1 Tax=Mya arenaria TaxID=6604 RepID=UPI0022E1A149|nr:microtubule-associated protein futsch-like [Mya arenaria]
MMDENDGPEYSQGSSTNSAMQASSKFAKAFTEEQSGDGDVPNQAYVNRGWPPESNQAESEGTTATCEGKEDTQHAEVSEDFRNATGDNKQTLEETSGIINDKDNDILRKSKHETRIGYNADIKTVMSQTQLHDSVVENDGSSAAHTYTDTFKERKEILECLRFGEMPTDETDNTTQPSSQDTSCFGQTTNDETDLTSEQMNGLSLRLNKETLYSDEDDVSFKQDSVEDIKTAINEAFETTENNERAVSTISENDQHDTDDETPTESTNKSNSSRHSEFDKTNECESDCPSQDGSKYDKPVAQTPSEFGKNGPYQTDTNEQNIEMVLDEHRRIMMDESDRPEYSQAVSTNSDWPAGSKTSNAFSEEQCGDGEVPYQATINRAKPPEIMQAESEGTTAACVGIEDTQQADVSEEFRDATAENKQTLEEKSGTFNAFSGEQSEDGDVPNQAYVNRGRLPGSMQAELEGTTATCEGIDDTQQADVSEELRIATDENKQTLEETSEIFNAISEDQSGDGEVPNQAYVNKRKLPESMQAESKGTNATCEGIDDTQHAEVSEDFRNATGENKHTLEETSGNKDKDADMLNNSAHDTCIEYKTDDKLVMSPTKSYGSVVENDVSSSGHKYTDNFEEKIERLECQRFVKRTKDETDFTSESSSQDTKYFGQTANDGTDLTGEQVNAHSLRLNQDTPYSDDDDVSFKQDIVEDIQTAIIEAFETAENNEGVLSPLSENDQHDADDESLTESTNKSTSSRHSEFDKTNECESDCPSQDGSKYDKPVAQTPSEFGTNGPYQTDTNEQNIEMVLDEHRRIMMDESDRPEYSQAVSTNSDWPAGSKTSNAFSEEQCRDGEVPYQATINRAKPPEIMQAESEGTTAACVGIEDTQQADVSEEFRDATDENKQTLEETSEIFNAISEDQSGDGDVPNQAYVNRRKLPESMQAESKGTNATCEGIDNTQHAEVSEDFRNATGENKHTLEETSGNKDKDADMLNNSAHDTCIEYKTDDKLVMSPTKSYGSVVENDGSSSAHTYTDYFEEKIESLECQRFGKRTKDETDFTSEPSSQDTKYFGQTANDGTDLTGEQVNAHSLRLNQDTPYSDDDDVSFKQDIVEDIQTAKRKKESLECQRFGESPTDETDYTTQPSSQDTKCSGQTTLSLNFNQDTPYSDDDDVSFKEDSVEYILAAINEEFETAENNERAVSTISENDQHDTDEKSPTESTNKSTSPRHLEFDKTNECESDCPSPDGSKHDLPITQTPTEVDKNSPNETDKTEMDVEKSFDEHRKIMMDESDGPEYSQASSTNSDWPAGSKTSNAFSKEQCGDGEVHNQAYVNGGELPESMQAESEVTTATCEGIEDTQHADVSEDFRDATGENNQTMEETSGNINDKDNDILRKSKHETRIGYKADITTVMSQTQLHDSFVENDGSSTAHTYTDTFKERKESLECQRFGESPTDETDYTTQPSSQDTKCSGQTTLSLNFNQDTPYSDDDDVSFKEDSVEYILAAINEAFETAENNERAVSTISENDQHDTDEKSPTESTNKSTSPRHLEFDKTNECESDCPSPDGSKHDLPITQTPTEVDKNSPNETDKTEMDVEKSFDEHRKIMMDESDGPEYSQASSTNSDWPAGSKTSNAFSKEQCGDGEVHNQAYVNGGELPESMQAELEVTTATCEGIEDTQHADVSEDFRDATGENNQTMEETSGNINDKDNDILRKSKHETRIGYKADITTVMSQTQLHDSFVENDGSSTAHKYTDTFKERKESLECQRFGESPTDETDYTTQPSSQDTKCSGQTTISLNFNQDTPYSDDDDVSFKEDSVEDIQTTINEAFETAENSERAVSTISANDQHDTDEKSPTESTNKSTSPRHLEFDKTNECESDCPSPDGSKHDLPIAQTPTEVDKNSPNETDKTEMDVEKSFDEHRKIMMDESDGPEYSQASSTNSDWPAGSKTSNAFSKEQCGDGEVHNQAYVNGGELPESMQAESEVTTATCEGIEDTQHADVSEDFRDATGENNQTMEETSGNINDKDGDILRKSKHETRIGYKADITTVMSQTQLHDSFVENDGSSTAHTYTDTFKERKESLECQRFGESPTDETDYTTQPSSQDTKCSGQTTISLNFNQDTPYSDDDDVSFKEDSVEDIQTAINEAFETAENSERAVSTISANDQHDTDEKSPTESTNKSTSPRHLEFDKTNECESDCPSPDGSKHDLPIAQTPTEVDKNSPNETDKTEMDVEKSFGFHHTCISDEHRKIMMDESDGPEYSQASSTNSDWPAGSKTSNAFSKEQCGDGEVHNQAYVNGGELPESMQAESEVTTATCEGIEDTQHADVSEDFRDATGENNQTMEETSGNINDKDGDILRKSKHETRIGYKADITTVMSQTQLHDSFVENDGSSTAHTYTDTFKERKESLECQRFGESPTDETDYTTQPSSQDTKCSGQTTISLNFNQDTPYSDDDDVSFKEDSVEDIQTAINEAFETAENSERAVSTISANDQHDTDEKSPTESTNKSTSPRHLEFDKTNECESDCPSPDGSKHDLPIAQTPTEVDKNSPNETDKTEMDVEKSFDDKRNITMYENDGSQYSQASSTISEWQADNKIVNAFSEEVARDGGILNDAYVNSGKLPETMHTESERTNATYVGIEDTQQEDVSKDFRHATGENTQQLDETTGIINDTNADILGNSEEHKTRIEYKADSKSMMSQTQSHDSVVDFEGSSSAHIYIKKMEGKFESSECQIFGESPIDETDYTTQPGAQDTKTFGHTTNDGTDETCEPVNALSLHFNQKSPNGDDKYVLPSQVSKENIRTASHEAFETTENNKGAVSHISEIDPHDTDDESALESTFKSTSSRALKFYTKNEDERNCPSSEVSIDNEPTTQTPTEYNTYSSNQTDTNGQDIENVFDVIKIAQERAEVSVDEFNREVASLKRIVDEYSGNLKELNELRNEVHILRQKNETLDETKTKLKEELKETTATNAMLQNEIQRLEGFERFAKEKADDAEKLAQELESVRGQFQKQQGSLCECLFLIQSREEELQNNQAITNTLREKLEETTATNAMLQDKVQRLKGFELFAKEKADNTEKLAQELESVRGQLQNQQGSLCEGLFLIQSKDQELQNNQAIINTLREEVFYHINDKRDTLKHTLDLTKLQAGTIEGLQASVQEKNETMKQLKYSYERLQDELAIARAENRRLNKEYVKLQAFPKDNENEAEQLELQLGTVRAELERQASELTETQARLSYTTEQCTSQDLLIRDLRQRVLPAKDETIRQLDYLHRSANEELHAIKCGVTLMETMRTLPGSSLHSALTQLKHFYDYSYRNQPDISDTVRSVLDLKVQAVVSIGEHACIGDNISHAINAYLEVLNENATQHKEHKKQAAEIKKLKTQLWYRRSSMLNLGNLEHQPRMVRTLKRYT